MSGQPPAAQRILITGAAGFLGQGLVRALSLKCQTEREVQALVGVPVLDSVVAGTAHALGH